MLLIYFLMAKSKEINTLFGDKKFVFFKLILNKVKQP